MQLKRGWEQVLWNTGLQRWAGCALLTLCIGLCARGQNAISAGTLSGRITDQAGAVVPGAKVTATDTGTGAVQTATTNKTGYYSFPILRVGHYSLTVGKPGFKTTQVANVVIQIGQAFTQNVRLQVGALSQQVTVHSQAPLLQPTQSTVSTVVNRQLIKNLPLSGRRYTDFVLLTPNAVSDGEFGLVSFGGQQGGGDSGYANGNGSNSFTVDGANATSTYNGGARGRTRVPYIYGEQSIKEFQVSDNPYNAAYGGAGSGFVNTITKSGTNNVHGNAFYYNRNSGTGADDAIDHANGVKTPLDVLQQFGADLGGPVARNRMFYYFDYEQQRELDPISVINTAVSGINESTFFPKATSLPSLPSPNGPMPFFDANSQAPSSTNSYQGNAIYQQQAANALYAIRSNLGMRQRRRDDISLFPKFDWQINNSNHLTLDYNYNRFSSPGGTITYNPESFSGIEGLSNNFVHDHQATLAWQHIFTPTLLNVLHFSYQRDDQIEQPSGIGIGPNFPLVELAGGAANGGFIGLGNWTFSLGHSKEYHWQANEDMTWIAGAHTLKFGAAYDHTHVTDFFWGNFRGTYLFLNPVAFAQTQYFLYSQSAGNPTFPFSYPYYGFYLQDKYQVAPRLTLNLGLREDFQIYSQPAENPAYPATGVYKNQYSRWAPRFGFAYEPMHNTVLRGGIGLFYDLLDGTNYENSVAGDGISQVSTSVCCAFNNYGFFSGTPPTFPNQLPSNSPGFSAPNISFIAPGFRTPSVLEASLELQRQFGRSTTVKIGTMWTHGMHLISSTAYDFNLIPPTGTTTYITCNAGQTAPNCTGPRAMAPTLDNGLLNEGLVSSTLGQINGLISPGLNQYNSGYVEVQRRVNRGLNLLVSYTYSKNLQYHGVDFWNQFDLAAAHGPSLLDQRQRLSIAGYYQPQFHNLALKNWMLSSVMQFNSGRPYAPLLSSSGDTLNDSAANESTNNTAVGIAGAGLSPVNGLDSFYGPWIDEVDLELARTFALSERVHMQFSAEAFNLLNHPNFFVSEGSGINQNIYNATGTTCGDGASVNQTCYLVPNNGLGGFGTLSSIDQLNGPRVFQFGLKFSF